MAMDRYSDQYGRAMSFDSSAAQRRANPVADKNPRLAEELEVYDQVYLAVISLPDTTAAETHQIARCAVEDRRQWILENQFILPKKALVDPSENNSGS